MAELAEANRQTWNKLAEQYDTEPWQIKLSEQVTTFIDENVRNGLLSLPPKSSGVSLLDYACGTGKVTRALKDHITRALGIDISDAMVDVYNSRMASDGVPNATAVVGNLLGGQSLPSDIDAAAKDFDIAFIGLGFHHFQDPKLTVERLMERLKPGGILAILDWLPSTKDPQYQAEEGAGHSNHHHHHHHHHQNQHQEAGHDHGQSGSSAETREDFSDMAHRTIAHDGFSEAMMRDLYSGAGLVDFGYVTMQEPLVLYMKGKRVQRTAFIAKARRSEEPKRA